MGAVRSILFRKKPPPARNQLSRPTRTPLPSTPAGATEINVNKNDDLLERLKSVYVESSDATSSYQRNIKPQSLPRDKISSEDDSFNIAKPKEGYLTVHQLKELFERVNGDPGTWTVEAVAVEYKISISDSQNLLKYFGGFKVVAMFKPSDHKLEFHPLHR